MKLQMHRNDCGKSGDTYKKNHLNNNIGGGNLRKQLVIMPYTTRL